MDDWVRGEREVREVREGGGVQSKELKGQRRYYTVYSQHKTALLYWEQST